MLVVVSVAAVDGVAFIVVSEAVTGDVIVFSSFTGAVAVDELAVVEVVVVLSVVDSGVAVADGVVLVVVSVAAIDGVVFVVVSVVATGDVIAFPSFNDVLVAVDEFVVAEVVAGVFLIVVAGVLTVDSVVVIVAD